MNPKIVKTQVVKSENVCIDIQKHADSLGILDSVRLASGASFPTKLTGIQLRKMMK